jgi:hypothetical protein
MNRYFTQTFYRFFFGFMVIIAVAFGLLLTTSVFVPEEPELPVTATPENS